MNQDNHDVRARIAALSPARREMLARLLSREGPKPAQTGQVPRDADIRLSELTAGDPAGLIKRFYDKINRNLNSSTFAEHVTFLNFGYVPNERPSRASVTLPAHHLNRNCIQLVLELVGDTRLDGREVLDVGCGRGGAVSIYMEHFRPARAIGLDLSPGAVAFCRAAHRSPRTAFVNADSQRLPFCDGSFDVVTNMESSGTYPDVASFYQEVFRVLRPGGAFLYTDLFELATLESRLESLRAAGFVLEVERDITSNVLLSRDQMASTHMATFTGENDVELMDNFLGAPGSDIYRSMQEGRSMYAIYRFRKP